MGVIPLAFAGFNSMTFYSMTFTLFSLYSLYFYRANRAYTAYRAYKSIGLMFYFSKSLSKSVREMDCVLSLTTALSAAQTFSSPTREMIERSWFSSCIIRLA